MTHRITRVTQFICVLFSQGCSFVSYSHRAANKLIALLYYRLAKKHLSWDTELASKKVFSKKHSLEKGAVFSAIASAWMTERYEAPTSSRSSSANDALTALAAADLSSRGSSPLPRRRRPPTSPPLQENPMQTQWTRGAQPHSFQKRARATLARLELAA